MGVICIAQERQPDHCDSMTHSSLGFPLYMAYNTISNQDFPRNQTHPIVKM